MEVPAEVVGRYVFYNNSSFDGNDAAANAADDGAIALDKAPLFAGQQGGFANYTSYSRGLNGIIVDVANLAAGGNLTADDFAFQVGNHNDTGDWAAAPAPQEIAVRPGEGQGGADRITLVWPDGAIAGQWLEVTVLATPDTGLTEPDVFYFGNAVGEAGDNPSDAKVNVTDMLLARNNPHTFLNPAAVDYAYDYNRDGRVNATDMLLARNNPTNFLNSLLLVTPT
jgi:hypothetical protein